MTSIVDWLFKPRSHPGFLAFNREDGYLEAILRGLRSKLLDVNDYANLSQCESLEDMKLHLAQTDYGDFLQNEAGPLKPAIIKQKCIDKMVNEFKYMKFNAVEPLSTFLDYVTYGYMIDNIILIITGALHERDLGELLERCHPLGMFKTIGTLTACHNVSEIYQSVLIDTPLGPYIMGSLNEEDFHDEEKNVEIIRNTLFSAYLHDFYNYCQLQGGETANIMGDILQVKQQNITAKHFLHYILMFAHFTEFPPLFFPYIYERIFIILFIYFLFYSLRRTEEPSRSLSTRLGQSCRRTTAPSCTRTLGSCTPRGQPSSPRPTRSSRCARL